MGIGFGLILQNPIRFIAKKKGYTSFDLGAGDTPEPGIFIDGLPDSFPALSIYYYREVPLMVVKLNIVLKTEFNPD